MLDINTIGILIASASLIVTAAIMIWQNIEARRTRQTELFMSILSGMREEEFLLRLVNVLKWEWDDFDDFEDKFGSDSNPGAYADFISVIQFFYQCGMLLYLKQINPIFLYETARGTVIRFWEKYEPYFKEYRIRYNEPRAQWATEYLYNEMKKRQQLETA